MSAVTEASLLIVLKARDEAAAVIKGSEDSIGKLGKAAAGAGLAVAAGLAAIGVESIKMAGEFQKQMTLLQTEAGYSAADVKRLNDQVLNLAPSVGKGPDELAMGLYHIASAGIPAAQAMDTLTAAAKLSSIGNADMESSTQAVIGVMAAYPQYAGNAMQATSMLNAIVGSGDMRMQQLAKAMATGILPAANTAKLGLIDVGAALSTLTDNVTPADEAATRLRMTFALLQHQSGPATDALASIGIKAGQLGTDMVKPNGLLVAITDLREHLGKTFGPETQGQTNKYLDILRKDGPDAADKYAKSVHGAAEVISVAFGGGRTSAAIQTLLGEYDKFSSKYVALNKGAGDFTHSWETTKETFSFQMRALGAASDAFMIRLGSFLLPIVTQVAKVLAEDIPKAAQLVGDWIGRNKQSFEDLGNILKTGLIFAFNVLKDALIVVSPLVWALTQHFDVMKPIIIGIVGAFLAWKAALMIQALITGIVEAMTLFAIQGGIVGAVVRAWTVAQAALDVALDANPIALAIIAIAALVAVVVLIITHFQQFKDILSKVGDYIMTGLTAVINWLKDHWVPIVLFLLEGPFGLVLALIVTHLSQIRSFLGGLLGRIGSMFSDLGAIIKNALGDAMGAVMQWFNDLPGRLKAALVVIGTVLLDGAKAAGLGLLHGISAGIKLTLEAIVVLPVVMLALLMGLVRVVILAGLRMGDAAREWGIRIVGEVVGFMAALPGRIWGFLVSAIQQWITWGTQLWSWASTAIPAFIAMIVGFYASIPGRVAATLVTLVNRVSDAFQAVWNWVAVAIPGAIGWVASLFAALPGQIAKALTGLAGIIGGAFSSALGWVGQHLSDWAGAIANWFSGLPGMIAGWLGSVANGIRNAGGSIISWMIEGIRRAPGALVDAIKGLFAGAVKDIPGVGGLLGKVFGAAKGGLVKAQRGGQMMLLAEGGEDEWVVPQSKVQQFAQAALSGGTGALPLAAAAGGSAGGGTMTINLMMDGRVLTQVVVDRLSRQHRQQSPRLGSATG